MAVTAADVKRLRELTGAGMMDCKKALEEAEGDFEKAVEILRVKGAKGVNKRAERTASNGLVTSHIEGTSHGVLLELNCETDFVAKTEGFQQMAADVSAFVAAKQPADIAELLGLEIEADKTIQQLLDEANATMGEKIEIRRFERFSDGYVTVYLHKHDPALPPSVGALVETDVDNEEVAKNVAQHIAAMSPLYLSREDVPEDTVANERRIAEETAREEGKPEQALPKIVEGRVNGFFKDVCLLEQPWVRDNKKTIGKYLQESGVTVTRFARFKVGQG
ncbi:MAG: translation elongation factor Ts [Candidatus Nanopelagicales bacterium]|jgi:elongation factor Ts|nr:translation elongation factor Ts [Candidatus Nanopelagicales bacterium]